MAFKFNANLPEPSLVALDGGLVTSAAPSPRSRRPEGPGGGGVLNAEGSKVTEVLDFLRGVYRRVRRNRRTGALHLELAADGRERVFSGNDVALVYLELAQEFGLTASKQLTTDAVEFMAVGNTFDPVADWFVSLRNETPIADELWGDLGRRIWSNATPLVTTITQRFLIAQVARCLDPGCDVSWMPIACGSQGVGKSATFRLLAPLQEYYAELGQTLEQLEREPVLPFKASLNVLEECDRVISGKGSNIEGLKNLISIRKQTFRRLYAKDASTLPRDFVFAGTSNRFDFLTDVESRRFFPITLPNSHDLDASAAFIKAHHRQLWARAVQTYDQGQPFHFSRAEVVDAAGYVAGYRTEEPLEEELDRFLAGRSRVQSHEVVAAVMGIAKPFQKRADIRRMTDLLKRKGWQQMSTKKNGRSIRVWKAPDGHNSQGAANAAEDF